MDRTVGVELKLCQKTCRKEESLLQGFIQIDGDLQKKIEKVHVSTVAFS